VAGESHGSKNQLPESCTRAANSIVNNSGIVNDTGMGGVTYTSPPPSNTARDLNPSMTPFPQGQATTRPRPRRQPTVRMDLNK